MAQLLIIRPIHPLPGREEAAISWLKGTAELRERAGQLSQYVLHNVVDPAEYVWIQVWESREAYQRWRESPERQRLADHHAQYFTQEPTRLYEVE